MSTPTSTHLDQIAIVGVSCLFPGAATPAEFWHNLVSGINTTSDATADQFGVDPAHFYDPARTGHDTTYALRGGFVRTPVTIPPGLTRSAGWTLYTAESALASAGVPQHGDRLRRCGLILGSLSFPTAESHRRIAPLYAPALERAIADLLGLDALTLPLLPDTDSGGAVLRSPAAVVAERLGLGGLHLCVDAACASTLYTIGLASAFLLAGQADLMLAGAVSAADPLFVNMGFTHFGAYPDGGSSRPLDTRSEGLIPGEGAGMVVLKRYADALRDGDRIYGVIAGIGLSNDGKGKHPLTPNSRGQILAFQRAYQRVDPAAVQYVECHASGTPLGDKTELASMDEFFGLSGTAPLIGSVKANHGHLLTVAGLASLLKVILSMEHGTLPATIGVEQPLTSRHFGADRVVMQNTPWSHPAKTAGINAFGFGGVSAHLVIQNATAAGQPRPDAITPPSQLAITGMDAHFGACVGLEAYANALYDGQPQFTPLPPRRWKGLGTDAPAGAYIDSFESDVLRFRFPPKADDQPTPQHLLLLQVADRAVQDAGLTEDANVAVIGVLGTELSLHQYRARLDLTWQLRDAVQAAGLTGTVNAAALDEIVKDAISPPAQVNQYTSYIGNVASSRISALWNFSGPAFTVTAGENGVYKALTIAGLLLADPALDAVVIGAVDLAAGLENVALRGAQHPVNTGTASLSFGKGVTGWTPGEGAGAIVLQRPVSAQGGRVYATLESVSVQPGADAAAVEAAIRAALTAADLRPDQIGSVEASASGIAAEDAAEAAALTHVYRGAGADPITALSSSKAIIGHTGAAAGMAAVIAAALSLGRRFIPAVPNWAGAADPRRWAGSAFYVMPAGKTWFTPAGTLRYAAVSGVSRDDASAAHVILSDRGSAAAAADHFAALRSRPLDLFPLAADDAAGLVAALDRLAAALDTDAPLNTIAAQMHAAFRAAGDRAYAAALVGRDRAALRKEINLARTGIPSAAAAGHDWHTPAGSAFSPRPLGPTGGVAFVYPGAFNSYPDHGRDWLHLFPNALDRLLERGSDDPGDQVSDVLLYPRTFAPPDRAVVREQRARLLNDPRAMMESGTVFAVLYTHILRDTFRVTPRAAFGYSLGETSMLWALDVWQDTPRARRLLRESPLFRSRLTGRKDAVREAWGIPATAPDEFWASFVLVCSPAAVTAQIAQEPRVYMTHVNTPGEVVIAGDPAACQRVIDRLGCEAVRAPFESVIHNDAILSEYEAFLTLYRQAVHPPTVPLTFYSAADYAPLTVTDDLIPRSMARVSLKPIDFPRLIDAAYADGARIFIELGPGSTCTRWVTETLKAAGRPHVAAAIDGLRLDDHTGLVKLLARLVSHRVAVDLTALYAPLTDTPKRLPHLITLGGDPVAAAIVTDEHRARVRVAAPVTALTPQLTAVKSAPTVTEPAAVPAAQLTAPLTGHAAALSTRRAGLVALADQIRQQFSGSTASVSPTPAAPVPVRRPVPPIRYAPRPAIFDTDRIDQFARGSIPACFGPEYAIYDGRRAPRIPNTDLMLISRVVQMDAERLITKTGSALTAEYDVPPDMWFYASQPDDQPFTPYSMLMEMALQPCGFLSAFMGPTLAFPDVDFYFRNLDGTGTLTRPIDLRGRTLVNRVVLTSSTILQGIIIQKYTFDMQLDGQSFYTGASTFGYFTQQALASQAGLDMGKPPQKWHAANPAAPLTRLPGNRESGVANPAPTLPVGQLAFLDEVLVSVDGGKHGLGYVYATNHVHPNDWYFACHFHEDPVMPGSLGLETIMQAVQAYARHAGLGAGLRAPRFDLITGDTVVWKYRGQVLSSSRTVDVEISITAIDRTADGVIVHADASLWKGDLRIYEFRNIGIQIVESAK